MAKRVELFHCGPERCSSVCVQLSFDPSNKLLLDSGSVSLECSVNVAYTRCKGAKK